MAPEYISCTFNNIHTYIISLNVHVYIVSIIHLKHAAKTFYIYMFATYCDKQFQILITLQMILN